MDLPQLTCLPNQHIKKKYWFKPKTFTLEKGDALRTYYNFKREYIIEYVPQDESRRPFALQYYKVSKDELKKFKKLPNIVRMRKKYHAALYYFYFIYMGE
jgi:hypothetical protein